MQRLVCFLLISAILVSGFTRVVFYAGFEINKEYIAKVLCVNKAKPTMNCSGKCYLAKKLKQADQNEQKQTGFSKHRFQEAFYSNKAVFKSYITLIEEYIIPPAVVYSGNYSGQVFHPPAC